MSDSTPDGPARDFGAISQEEFEAVVEERIAELHSIPATASSPAERLDVDEARAAELAGRVAAALKRFTAPEAPTPGAPGVAWEEIESVARELADAERAGTDPGIDDRPDTEGSVDGPGSGDRRPTGLSVRRMVDPATGETTLLLRTTDAGKRLYVLTLVGDALAGIQGQGGRSGSEVVAVTAAPDDGTWLVSGTGRSGGRVRIDDLGSREAADAAGLRRHPDLSPGEVFQRLTGMPLQRPPRREWQGEEDTDLSADADESLAEMEAHDQDLRQFSALLRRTAGEIARAAERAARRRQESGRPESRRAETSPEASPTEDLPTDDPSTEPEPTLANEGKSAAAEAEKGPAPEEGAAGPGATRESPARQRFCTACGTPRKDDNAFCTECGQRF